MSAPRISKVSVAGFVLAACVGGPLTTTPEVEATVDWPEARRLTADVSAWDAASSATRHAVARVLDERLHAFRLLRLETFASGGARHEVAVFEHAPTRLEFSLVPGGGLPAGRTVSAGFLVARTEVPQRVWEATLGSNPSTQRDGERPVEGVSWTEATGFCRSLHLELPTSAQWELACRAGTATRFSFGDDPDDLPRHAWFDANAAGGTRPVAGLRPNAFGLFDVHGNVREWCRDRVGGYGADARRSLALRVVRGGGWNYPGSALGAAVRNWGTLDTRAPNIGLRPVRSLAGR